MLRRFLQYVEIQTKLASVLPFLLGLAYAWMIYGRLSALNTSLFLASMLFFDMATTALNNYTDSKSNGIPLPFSRQAALTILLVLLLMATGIGLTLAFQVGWILLAAGALCFGMGIFYTFGAAPISRMPLGEVFSGLFMGFFIPFLTVISNDPHQVPLLATAPAASLTLTGTGSLAAFSLSGGIVQIAFDLVGLLRLFLLTLVPICGIANIMLANNICDVDHDRQVDRFTLPYYLGPQWSQRLFAGLYGLALAAVAALAIFRILPVYGLAPLLVTPLLRHHIRQFQLHPVKAETFVLSIRNFVLLMVPQIIVTALAAALRA